MWMPPVERSCEGQEHRWRKYVRGQPIGIWWKTANSAQSPFEHSNACSTKSFVMAGNASTTTTRDSLHKTSGQIPFILLDIQIFRYLTANSLAVVVTTPPELAAKVSIILNLFNWFEI